LPKKLGVLGGGRSTYKIEFTVNQISVGIKE